MPLTNRKGIGMSKGKAQDTFRAKASGIMAKLMADFPLQLDDVAAILGNFGHECFGFTPSCRRSGRS